MNAPSTAAMEWPTFKVPGISSSGTRCQVRKIVVVVAKFPIPRVSKKVVTKPVIDVPVDGTQALLRPAAWRRRISRARRNHRPRTPMETRSATRGPWLATTCSADAGGWLSIMAGRYSKGLIRSVTTTLSIECPQREIRGSSDASVDWQTPPSVRVNHGKVVHSSQQTPASGDTNSRNYLRVARALTITTAPLDQASPAWPSAASGSSPEGAMAA